MKKYKGKRTRNLVPKVLNIILEILYNRPSEAKLEAMLDNYYKETDTKQKCEFRNIFKELKVLLRQKKVRVIDMLRLELQKYAW